MGFGKKILKLKWRTVTSALVFVLAGCQTTTAPKSETAAVASEGQPQVIDETEPQTQSAAGIFPVGSALGPHPMTPTWAVMVADVRVRLSDDTVCRDKSQTEARWNAGTYSGSFANCPGMTYHLVVETPAEAALMMVSTYIMNKPLKYRMDVTMADGRVFENVKRMH